MPYSLTPGGPQILRHEDDKEPCLVLKVRFRSSFKTLSQNGNNLPMLILAKIYHNIGKMLFRRKNNQVLTSSVEIYCLMRMRKCFGILRHIDSGDSNMGNEQNLYFSNIAIVKDLVKRFLDITQEKQNLNLHCLSAIQKSTNW